MRNASNKSVTQLLMSAEQGDSNAAEQLLNVIYEDLRRMAYQQMKKESPGHTLSATALVHEAYLRLMEEDPGASDAGWENRRHFFAAAARAMRQILVDRARKRHSQKRGGAFDRRPLDTGVAVIDPPADAILDLDEALRRLEQRDARKAQIVSLRYFAGLTVRETALALKISTRTVDNEWQFARAWLHRELADGLNDRDGESSVD